MISLSSGKSTIITIIKNAALVYMLLMVHALGVELYTWLNQTISSWVAYVLVVGYALMIIFGIVLVTINKKSSRVREFAEITKEQNGTLGSFKNTNEYYSYGKAKLGIIFLIALFHFVTNPLLFFFAIPIAVVMQLFLFLIVDGFVIRYRLLFKDSFLLLCHASFLTLLLSLLLITVTYGISSPSVLYFLFPIVFIASYVLGFQYLVWFRVKRGMAVSVAGTKLYVILEYILFAVFFLLKI